MSDLRRQIIEASVAIVAKDGVRALSFREVARRAKVSHQAPYHHFKNHHGILRAISKEGFKGLADAMDKAARRAGPHPIDSLNSAGLAYVAFARTHLGHFRVMFQNSLILKERRLESFEEAEKAHGVLLRLAKAAHDSGLGHGLSVNQIALMCWSLVHGIATLLTEQVPPGAREKKASAQMASMVVGGLSALLRASSSNRN